MFAVVQNGRGLEYATNELKRDKDFILAAVKQDASALGYASDNN